MPRLAFLCVLLTCAACDDGADPLADAGATGAVDARVRDAGAADVGPADAAIVDVGLEDGGAADSGAPDADVGDAGLADAEVLDAEVLDADAPDADVADSGPVDAGAADAGLRCDYIALNVCIVECPAGYTYANELVDTNGVCPSEVELNGNRYPDILAATMGEGCSSACVYKASTSVSFIDHCNRRNGYIVFEARGRGCPDLYEFSNGLFLSRMDWEQATPCP